MDERITNAQRLLAKAQAALPRLTYFGIGIQHRKDADEATLQQEFSELRARMSEPNELEEIAVCADWLALVQPIKAMHYGSYGCKHRVERWCAFYDKRRYIANGSFIAAAVGLDYPYRICSSSPNVDFGFSKKCIRELEYDALKAGGWVQYRRRRNPHLKLVKVKREGWKAYVQKWLEEHPGQEDQVFYKWGRPYFRAGARETA